MEAVESIDVSLIEIKKYLKKLVSVVNNESTFTFLDVKFVNKTRVDDVLCCVEANFPDKYKKLLKNKTVLIEKEYKSILPYQQLCKNIRRSLFFSPNTYMISYSVLPSLIDKFCNLLEKDIKQLYKNP